MSIKDNFPSVGPSLNLNFARSKTLDPRITFSRTSTATRVNEQGLVEVVSADIPRFDHEYDPVSGTVRSLGLLVEESRSNLVTYSSDMSQWTNNGSPIYADNDTTAPDGTLTADKLTENTAAANGRWIEVTISANTTYTVASFIKPTDQPRTRIGVYSNVGSWYGNVDTDWDANGEPTTQNSVGASNIKYEPYLNGWYRVSFQFTSPSTINGTIQYFHMPDRTASGKFAWFWGAQLEAGAFPTSYIPTSGGTATRNPDDVSIVGDNFSDVYNQTEGSYKVEGFIDGTLPSNTYGGIFGAGGGSATSNFIFLNPSNSFGQYVSNTSQTPNSTLGKTYTNGAKFKIAASYLEADFACSFNGDISNSSTSGALYGSMTYFRIGGNPINGLTGGIKGAMRISNISYYPKQITDTQLQNLTK